MSDSERTASARIGLCTFLLVTLASKLGSEEEPASGMSDSERTASARIGPYMYEAPSISSSAFCVSFGTFVLVSKYFWTSKASSKVKRHRALLARVDGAGGEKKKAFLGQKKKVLLKKHF